MKKVITKEFIMEKIAQLCEAEQIKTVKEFREFFEYWIIGMGEMDDDFSDEAKRIAKINTVAQWKKGYKMIDDTDIQSVL